MAGLTGMKNPIAIFPVQFFQSLHPNVQLAIRNDVVHPGRASQDQDTIVVYKE